MNQPTPITETALCESALVRAFAKPHAHTTIQCTTCFDKGELCIASSSSTGDPLDPTIPGTIPASVRAQLRLFDLTPSTWTSATTSTPSQATGLRTPGTTLTLPTHMASRTPGGPLPFFTVADLAQTDKHQYRDRGMRRGKKWKGKGREGDEDLEHGVPGLEWIRKVLEEIRGEVRSLSEVGKKVAARTRRIWGSLKG